MLGFDRVDDEAVLRSIHHPDHRSGMREGVWAGAIVTFLGVGFFYFVNVPWLPDVMEIAIIGLLAGVAAFSVIRWISRSDERKRIKAEIEYREHSEKEKENKLKRARETGAFDRWET